MGATTQAIRFENVDGPSSNIVIQGNLFESQAIVFEDGAVVTDLTIVNNLWSEMSDATGVEGAIVTQFDQQSVGVTLENVLIANNVFPDHGLIDLGLGQSGVLSIIGSLSIVGNRFDTSTPASPPIGIKVNGASQKGNILISDNSIRMLGSAQTWSIEVIGNPAAGVDDDMSVMVSENQIQGSDGIHVKDATHVTVKNNSMPHERGATETDADLTASQIWVEGENEYAFVSGNDVALGDKGDQTSLGGVINVEASLGGMVQENSVIGHEVGGVDTAINVDGPLYVANNSYVGIGPRWASAKTPLSKGIVVVGDNAVIGENNMDVDVSGATTPSFARVDSDRWTSSVALTVTSGLIEVPFKGDVEIIEVEAYLSTQPTGSAVTIDLNKNGTTMYTTQANRPSVAVAANSDTTVPDVTSISDGDTLSVDIDAIDSGGDGAGLSVTVRYRRA